MLSRLGSVIGSLFSPLQVKKVASGSENKLNQLSEEPRTDTNKRQGSGKKHSGGHPNDSQNHEPAVSDAPPPGAQSAAPSAETSEPQFDLRLPSQVEHDGKTASEKDAAAAEAARKVNLMSGTWLELKNEIGEGPARAAQATVAYETGLKKKRSLLKNSKGGMVDKKAA